MDKASIISGYLSGISTEKLAPIHGISPSSIIAVLKAAGVPRRDRYEARMVYPVRNEAFARLTPEASYWVGFLMADGCVLDESKVVINLQRSDVGHLEKLRRFIGSEDRPIHHIASVKACQLKFHSRRIVSDLARYGVVPRKSLSAVSSGEAWKQPAFWLGVMDGDGTIDLAGKRRHIRVRLCGSVELMNQFSSFLQDNVSGRNGRLRPEPWLRSESFAVVSIGGARALNFLRLAYGSSPVSLDRKREISMSLTRGGL